jgi:hypothetical protein
MTGERAYGMGVGIVGENVYHGRIIHARPYRGINRRDSRAVRVTSKVNNQVGVGAGRDNARRAWVDYIKQCTFISIRTTHQ